MATMLTIWQHESLLMIHLRRQFMKITLANIRGISPIKHPRDLRQSGSYRHMSYPLHFLWAEARGSYTPAGTEDP
jgi:hypothetical protein